MRIVKFFLIIPLILFVLYLFIHIFVFKEIIEQARGFVPFMDADKLVIKGWDGQEPAWILKAASADLSNREHGQLFGITEGCIFGDKGGKIIRDITAEQGQMDLSGKEMILQKVSAISRPVSLFKGDMTFYSELVTAQQDQLKADKVSVSDKETTVSSGVVIFKRDGTAIELNDQVEIIKKDLDLNAAMILVDTSMNAILYSPVIKQKVRSDKNNYLVEISARQMDYKVYGSKYRVIFEGDFMLKVNNLVIRGDKATYWAKDETMLVEGKSSIVFMGVKNLVPSRNIDLPDGSSVKADRLFIDLKKENMTMKDNISFKKDNTLITAKEGAYDLNRNSLEVYKNVRIQEKGRSLSADKVNISLKDKSFEAIGSVSTRIEI